MHKLERSSVTPPECLAEYDYQQQKWDDLHSECKRQLRAVLNEMQSEDTQEHAVRCAYCESAIHCDGHIEHFRRKNPKHFPELTFEWTNLFISCDSPRHCGIYKDRPSSSAYDPECLIKPDKEDPEQYLYFHSSGHVRVREGLSDEDKHKASETIRVFGLNNASLPSQRAKAVSAYKQTVLECLDEIATWGNVERAEYLESEIEETQWEPYATTIKHFLQRAG